LTPTGDVYKILNHVTGDNLFTHALPRAFRFASPIIKALYPELESAEKPENLAKLDTLLGDARARGVPLIAACQMWISWLQEPGTAGLEGEYAIESHADSWLQFDPVAELESMVGKEKIIAVEE